MMDRISKKRNEEGFTLIELLIVIIILAILAAIVVFAVGTTTGESKKAACNADAKSVETATEAFKAQTGSFPTGMSQLTTSGANGPWLRSAPSATVANNGYAVFLDVDTPITAGSPVAGQVDVTTGTTTISYDAQTSSTGCNTRS